MTRAIALLVAVMYCSATSQDIQAADPPRRDGELLQFLNLDCRDKDQDRKFQSALESTSPQTLKRAEILVLYAQCLLRAKQHASDAVPLLKEAVQILPANAGVRRHLGAAYFQLGMDQEAIEAYERSLELAPDADTYGQLGFVLMRAVSGLVVYLNPDTFNEYMARSEEQLRRAISLSLDNYMFHSHLGSCLIGRGKQEEGISELHRAIDLIPTFKEWESPAHRAFALADLHLSLGQVYWGSGKKAEGERLMNLAVEQAPNERAREHLKLLGDSTMGRVPPSQRKADLKMTEDAMRKAIFDPFEEAASHDQ